MVFAIPATATDHLVEGEMAVVAGTNGSGLNVRSEPSSSSDVKFIADEGTPMQVTSGPHEADGVTWHGVQIDGRDAWVVADFVSGHAAQAGVQVEVVNTNGHGLRVRGDASSHADTLNVLSEGSVVDVIGDEVTDEAGTTWINVAFNGSSGYAHSDYLAVVSAGGQNSEDSSQNDDQNQSNEPEQAEEIDAAEENEAVAEEHEPEPDPEPEPQPDPEPEPEPAPEPADSNGVSAGSNAEIVGTNGYGLNIRTGAGYGNSVVTIASEGHVMYVVDGPEVANDGSNWWQVDYRGHSGWAHADYLQATDAEQTGEGSGTGQSSDGNSDNDNGDTPPASSAVGEQIVNQAMQFLGYPYVWGGTTPAGFDCSGFLYYVVNQVTGDGFPRLLDGQINRGTHVPSDQLQPGDLVFQQNTYQWGLSHGGIYIGNGQFIHASTPGTGVIVSDLWDGYWGQRYYTARRIS
jgi:cell wall-associated NlpC family hydrolase